MNNSQTFFFYLSRRYIISTLLMLLTLITVVVMFDVLELTKKALSKNIPYQIVIKLSLLKTPYLFQELVPFSIMLGTVFSFTVMNKNNEITAFKSLGISPWKISLPFIISSMLLGVIDTTVISRITSLTQKELNNIENIYLNNNQNIATLSENGIWFRENINQDLKKLIHIQPTNENHNIFSQVKIYYLDSDFEIKRSLFSEQAKLENGTLKLFNVIEYKDNLAPELITSVEVPTVINLQKIHKGILEPKSISLIGLPSFITKLEKLGFATTKFRLYFFQLLFAPFLFCSLSLLGLALCFSTPRSNKINIMIAISVFLGFTLYFLFRLISALALAGKISTFSAVIVPIVIFVLIGATIVMHFEEE